MNFRIGIDTGGTFTDAVVADENGNLTLSKSPTTPKDLKLGVFKCIDELAEKFNMERGEFLDKVTAIVHGTTQGTNAILTRSGPKLGMITTQGHRDVIQLRRVVKDNAWDWRVPFPEPLIPRYLRVGVEERVSSRGEVLKPLVEASVHKAVAYLKELDVKSIVVALLFSFLHPEHEKRILEIINTDYPEAQVTLSHEVLPAVGEYERFNTALIDAYIRPAIISYIKSLEDFLKKEGFKGQLLFMQNNGGIETGEVAMAHPATLAISGPAAGPVAARMIGELHGSKNLLSIDMGGTSFDITIIDNGRLITKTESVIGDHRFSLPVIDVETLGAGGGSIAWFDLGGTLQVGPKSAGAEPGPACYGSGGEEPTVTDANVVMGYISPDYFLGGKMKLQKNLAEKAIKKNVADRLGISVPQAAAAIYKVSNSVMANGVTRAFIKKGYDPRDFVLCSGGSATSLSALKIAEDLGIKQVLITKISPVYCPFGMLGVDLRHDFSRFYHASGNELDLNHVKKLYEEMETEGLPLLDKEGISKNQRILLRTMRLRYWGQFREVEVPWPNGPITRDAVAQGIANFHTRHKELYGSSDENYPIDFMGFGLAAVGKMPKVMLKKINQGSEDPSFALKGERDAYFEETNGFVKTKIYNGDKLLANNILEGPCIVEESMTTVVIPPGFKMQVDEYGNYISL